MDEDEDEHSEALSPLDEWAAILFEVPLVVAVPFEVEEQGQGVN